jgi:hypothetical protein
MGQLLVGPQVAGNCAGTMEIGMEDHPGQDYFVPLEEPEQEVDA